MFFWAQRYFLTITIASAILVVLTTMTVNYVIDYKNMLTGNPIEDIRLRAQGYHHSGDGLVFYDMQAKLAEIEKIRPASNALGASPVFLGIDPLHKGWSKSIDGPTYNAGILCVDVKTTRELLEHAIAQGTVKQVIFGMSFFSFNSHTYPNNEGCPTNRWIETGFYRHRVAGQYLLYELANLRTLAQSVKFALSERRNGQPTPFTWYREPDLIQKSYLAYRGAEVSSYEAPKPTASEDQRYYFRWYQIASIGSMFYNKRFGFSLQSSLFNPSTPLAEFAKIVRLCRDNEIDFKAFFTPIHVRAYEVIRLSHIMPQWENWKRDVVRIVHDTLNNQSAIVWDFATFNDITTFPVRDGILASETLYHDPIHFKLPVGNRILDQLFSEIDTGFGVKLTMDMVDEHIASVRSDAEAYRRQHPEEMAEVMRSFKIAGRF